MNGNPDCRLLSRIALRNYKSIASCDVRPASLSFLVGENGSGKSNFLDALRFVSDALRSSLDHALRDRGGIGEVRRRSHSRPNHFAIRLDFELSASAGWYGFEIAARPGGGFAVRREECDVLGPGTAKAHRYLVKGGEVVECTLDPPPPCASDRLYLVPMAGFEAFRPVYDALSTMGFYNLEPRAIRELQSPDSGELLKRDGSNLASVVRWMQASKPALKTRVEEYLSKVVAGITSVESKTVGPKETLRFHQEIDGARRPWNLYSSSMSDGTLRALGLLVALFHQDIANGSGARPQRRLVGICGFRKV